jgi:adenylate cyclase
MEIFGFDVGYIRTLDKGNKNLIVRAARGLSSPEFLSTSFSLDSPEPIVGTTVFKSQKPHISADVRKDPAFKARIMEREGLVSLAMVPILSEGNVHGFIGLGSKRLHHFSEVELRLIFNSCSQLGTALANAQVFESVQAQAAQLKQRVHEQLAQIERLRRFLPPQVADLIVASGTEKQLESHRREITALFCDLRGFTGFSEIADPEDVMALLRDYHAAIGQIIFRYGGTLERFAGDGVMVIFNDPVPVENPALQAVLMALDMRTAIGAMIEKWRLLGHDLGFGIGIAHGFATLGTIGFEGRYDYAAIGTVSNVASRLCDEAKRGQILITPQVMLAVVKAVTVELVGEFNLKGIRRPMMTYNVVKPL